MSDSTISLEELMAAPLPSKYYQKRLMFRPNHWQVTQVYNIINDAVFYNRLKRPEIIIKPRCRTYWGMCTGATKKHKTGSYCQIHLMDKWISAQWMIATLAHEMVHQYQWDIEGPLREEEGRESLMSHGPSFFQFRDILAENGIPLKTAHSLRRWYMYQDLFKC